MEPFQVKDLYSITGNPGLWRVRRYVEKSRMGNFANLVDEFKTVTVSIDKVAKIDNIIIYTTDTNGVGGQKKLEDVFGDIMTFEEKEKLPDNFSALSDVDKHLWMDKLVPGHDNSRFKPYHMDKIMKWYKELRAAIKILNEGIEDIDELNINININQQNETHEEVIPDSVDAAADGTATTGV